MTEFISRNYGKEGYEIIIKTDSHEHYKAAESFARRLINHSKPMTNAQKIRAMSDEELAKAIASKAYTGACNDFDISYDGNCCHNCEKCDAIIKWLQQPAE